MTSVWWTAVNEAMGCCRRSAAAERHHDPRSRQKTNRSWLRQRPGYATGALHLRLLFLTILFLISGQARAAFIEFQNCLNNTLNDTTPHSLQFIPQFFDAKFNTSDPSHNIDITVYGNVQGATAQVLLPPPSDPRWNDPKFMDGKILNFTQNSNGVSNYSALIYDFGVLTYTPYSAPPSRLCNSLRDGTNCPIAPVFNVNVSDPHAYRAFGFDKDLNSSFRFATLDATIYVDSGELNPGSNEPKVIGCISASITPDLGKTLRGLLAYLPVVILIFVAISTISAGIFSPWGTSDLFKWSSNYGRDEDLLRLVTPGFGDCLQYIQFILFSGSLSLNYPGYFSPIVSQVSWSALLFNESFVSNSPGTQSLQDGVYVIKGDYGLTRMSQLIGMADNSDLWAGMVIWLLVITGIVIVICQLGFLVRWGIMVLKNQKEQDLRSKNWPMTGGNLVRIVCNFFLLPIVALSMFQLVIAVKSPAVLTVFAVILLVAILAFAGWILRIILAEKQRSRLFDDLPTVLLYGPLYNTYSDDAAPFALIPAMLTFIRAVAIGAVQPSGVAQLVILAICEVILILTLHAFRPFRAQTSMNAYHTFFSVARLVITLLSVAFVQTLGVTERTKGWIGYAILLLHGVVLVFGFLLNSIQTLVEVGARAAGAGGDESTGAATRGALVKVFGSRQLSRRARRTGFRNSLNSDAAMLTDDNEAVDGKSAQFGGRSRSLSASSAILLNQRTPDRMSTHLDRTESGSGDAERSEDTNAFSFIPDASGAAAAGGAARPNLNLKTNEPGVPTYRPPRARRPTGDLMTPGARSRGSWAGELKKAAEENPEPADPRDSTGRPLSFVPDSRASPSPAYMRQREGSDPVLNDPNRTTNVDYAVREVDFYYGMRGPALSNQPTRKLKTGPADPVGPVSSATGWFRGMLGRKTKDSGKGFEVIRSSKAPPEHIPEESPSPESEPYHDSPKKQPAAVLPGQRTRSTTDDDTTQQGTEARQSEESRPSAVNSEDEEYERKRSSHSTRKSRVSDMAPALGELDTGSDLRLPSRFGSKTSSVQRQPSTNDARGQGSTPYIPRKSSKRESFGGPSFEPARLSTVPSISERQSFSPRQSDAPTSRLPFSSGQPSPGQRSMGAESALSLDPPEPTFARGEHSRPTSGNSNTFNESDRPTSYGYINQYRQSDSITHGSPEIGARSASAAEIVDDSHRKSRSGRDSNGRGSTGTTETFGW